MNLGARRGPLACKSAEPGHHIACPPAARDHPLDRSPDLTEVGFGTVQPAQAGLAVYHHGRKRLVHLMCDRGGKFAERADAGDMGQFCPQAVQCVFRGFLICHVVVGRDRPDGLAPGVPVERPAAGGDDARAVALGVDQLALPAVVLVQLIENALQAGRQGRFQQIRHAPTDRFFGFPAIELLGTEIPVGDETAHVAHDDRVMRQVEQRGLIGKVLCRLLVLHGEKCRDADRTQADEGADQRSAVPGSAVNDGVAGHRHHHADAAYQEKAAPIDETRRSKDHDGIEDRNGGLQRCECIDQEDGCRRHDDRGLIYPAWTFHTCWRP